MEKLSKEELWKALSQPIKKDCDNCNALKICNSGVVDHCKSGNNYRYWEWDGE